MVTRFAFVGSYLVVAYEEIKMLALFLRLYPQDFVDFFTRNYFRFLDDFFHKWLQNFEIEAFYNMINNPDPDFKVIFENLSKSLYFLISFSK